MNKTEKIVFEIAREIRENHLKVGQKLSSVRNAAEDYSVSKNTIIEAYDRLSARGMIIARRGSGYFVAERSSALTEVNAAAPRHVLEAADRISLLESQLNQDFNIRVGDGRPPASWMEGVIPRRLSSKFFEKEIEDRTGYGRYQGNLELRTLICARNRALGVDVSEEQLVTTFGANHGLDLIIRRYLDPGDTVLVDSPGYYPLFAKLELAQVHMVGVRRTKTGPDLGDLQMKVARENPSFFFTQSIGQNPTGSSMDLTTAHGVLQISNKSGMIVVDDDPFVDLPNVGGQKLAELDQFRSMIFVGTFSKVVSASFRSGYIIAPHNIAAEIAEFKLITSVNSSRFSEIMIVEMMESRRYHKHLQKLGRRLINARSVYNKEMSCLNLDLFTQDAQGYYSFVMLPDGMSDIEFAYTAAQSGIFVAPSTPFVVHEDQNIPAIRINVTRADDARFFNFMHEHFG